MAPYIDCDLISMKLLHSPIHVWHLSQCDNLIASWPALSTSNTYIGEDTAPINTVPSSCCCKGMCIASTAKTAVVLQQNLLHKTSLPRPSDIVVGKHSNTQKYAQHRKGQLAVRLARKSNSAQPHSPRKSTVAQNLKVSDFCFLFLPLSFACAALRFCCAAF